MTPEIVFLQTSNLEDFSFLVLTTAKRISKLHCLSYQGWRSSTFSFLSNFMAKILNPSVYDPRFEEVTVPSLANFVDKDRDEMLLCRVKALKKYFSRMEQPRPACFALFISMIKSMKWVSQNTILFWIRLLISHAYKSTTDDDCRAVKV